MNKKYLVFVSGTILIIGVLIFSIYQSKTENVLGGTVLQSFQGGTGTSTNPKADQILIGGNNNRYDVKTLTAGSNITIASTSGAITIASTASGGGATDQLGQIGDVSTSTLAYGHLLMWNGVDTWQDTATSSLGITGAGTVTSVAISVPTGLAISGSPITTAGTLALTYDTGYVGVLTASTTNWNAFYDTPSNRITAGDYIDWSGNTLNVAGTLPVSIGGTGASTLTGLLQGNGTSAITGVTGAAGQIPYYNGTNTLLATSTIFLSTAGNIGIGTASPNKELTVVSSADYPTIWLGESTTVGGIMEWDATNDVLSLKTTDHSYPINFGNDWVRIDNTGNVGIGTTTPAAKLQVFGTSEQFRLNYNTSSYWTDTIALDGGRVIAGFGTDADLNFDFSGATDGDFSVNTNDLFVDTSLGYMGIGIATPGTKLDVIDDSINAGFRVRHSNLSQGISIGYNTIIANGSSVNQEINITSKGAGNILLNNGNVGIGEAVPGSKLSVSGGATIGASYDTTAAPSNGMIIQGNIGIGTTSPGTLLSLGNTGVSTINISATATSTFGYGINLLNGCFAINGVCVAGSSGTGITSLGATGQAQTGAVQTFATSTDTNLGFTIISSGDTHTFTTSWAGTLTAARIGLLSGFTDASTILGGDRFPFYQDTSGANRDISWDNLMGQITNTGTLADLTVTGLSTLNGGASTTLLTVSGDSWFNTIKSGIWNGTAIADAYISSAATWNAKWDALSDISLTKGYFVVGNDAGLAQATSSVFISSTGNVGIGTTGPSKNLHIYSSSANSSGYFETDSESSYANFRFDAGANAAGHWAMGVGGASVSVTGLQNKFYIATADDGNAKLVINSSGNVGIGTTSPAMKLSVQGSALADDWLVYSPMSDKSDALSEIKNIKCEIGTSKDGWCNVDHASLPSGVRVQAPHTVKNIIGYKPPVAVENWDEEKKATTTSMWSEPIMEEKEVMGDYMSMTRLTAMLVQSTQKLDTRVTDLEIVKLGGSINSQGEYISEAIKQEIDNHIDAKKDEIKNYVIEAIQDMSFTEKIKLLFQ